MTKSAIIVMGGKITLTDSSSKAWENYLKLFDIFAQKTKSKAAIIHFEAPDVKRGLLDAVPRDYMEKKFKIRIDEGTAREVPVKVARQILEMSKGFDIAVRLEAVEIIFFHTGQIEILSDLQLASTISGMLQKMFPKANVKG